MSGQHITTKLEVDGIYLLDEHQIDGHEHVEGNHEQYPPLHSVAISPDGTLAIVHEVSAYNPSLALMRLADWFANAEDGIRTKSERIKQHPFFVELNSNETALHNFKQRIKFLLAMVGLVGIAVIFALFQLSKAVIPPLPAIETTGTQPVAAVGLENNVAAVAATSTGISPLFSPEVQAWGDLIVQWAAEYDVDPNAVATIMQIESCGDPLAESYAGAQGLFQVMPFHFEPHENMKDPATNARRGIAYYKLGLELSGDWGLALAGYNGGHSLAKKSRDQWAHETQRYYYWGTGIYADAMAGKTTSPRLDEWMAAGGASLCAQASSRIFPAVSN